MNDKGGEKMPILNSIKTAEAKAEQLRADANEKVRTILEESKIQTEMTLRQMQEDYQKKDAALSQTLIRDIEQKKSEIAAKTALETAQIAKLAKTRMPEATDFLLKKVLKS